MKKDFIFQIKFSNTAEKVIKQNYQLPSDDKILLAIWGGRSCSVPVRERGFLFTKQGFAWNFSTVEVSGNEGENIERSQCNCNFLSRENTDFKLVFAKTDGIANELHLKTGLTEYIFLFPTDFPKEEINELEKIIRDYFTGYFNKDNFAEKAKQHSLLLSLFGVPDFCTCFCEDCSKKWNKLKILLKDFFKSKKKPDTQNNETNDKAEKASKKTELKNSNSYILLIDLLADIFLASGVVKLVKEGIAQDFYINFFRFILFFTVLKIIIIFMKKNAQKIISILLLLILSIAILSTMFSMKYCPKEYLLLFKITFTAISILILLTLQFALGYSKKTIAAKTCVFIILCYICIPLISSNIVQKQLINLVKNLMNEIFKWWTNKSS